MLKEPIIVMGWNCWVGNPEVGNTLDHWMKKYEPDLIDLSEAVTHHKPIGDACRENDYLQQQEQPGSDLRDGTVNEAGDSAILIKGSRRKQILIQHLVHMQHRWMVPSHDKWHTPRRYQQVVLKLAPGVRFRNRASHFPTQGFDGGPHQVNKAAFEESAAHSKDYLLARDPNDIVTDVGDLNEQMNRLKEYYGRNVRIDGSGIDLMLSTGVSKVEHTQLGKGGSDAHFGQLYKIW